MLTGVFKRPFAEQVAFFRNKLGRLVPTRRWDDIQKSAHDHAFMVAGAQKADLLADLAAAVDRAIAEGQSLEAFRRDFRDIVNRRGWHGWTGEGTKAGEAWRTRVIYQTNAATSYAAGRLAQLREGGFKYWVYRHNHSVTHPRPLHLAWDGITLPPDHPWWRTHYTPNGWGCRCYILGARSEAGARRLGGDPGKKLDPAWGKIDPKTGAPVGIDKGWDYSPGDSVSATVSALAKKTATLPPEIAVAYGAMIRRQIADTYSQWIDTVLQDRMPRGRSAVWAVMGEKELQFLKKKGRAPQRSDVSVNDRLVVGKKAVRHEAAGDALSDDEWRGLSASYYAEEKAVLYDNDSGNILYVLPPASGEKKIKVVVKPDYWDTKAKETVASSRAAFKIDVEALMDRRKYTVIDGEIK